MAAHTTEVALTFSALEGRGRLQRVNSEEGKRSAGFLLALVACKVKIVLCSESLRVVNEMEATMFGVVTGRLE